MDNSQRVYFAKGMHSLIDEVLEGRIENGYLVARLKGAIKWVESLPKESVINEKKKKRKVNEPSPEEIRDVFEYWRKVTGRSRTRLTSDKKRHISGRLRDGFSVKQLINAIDQSQVDPWCQGQNEKTEGKKYDFIDNIFRNSSKVEKLLEAYDDSALGDEIGDKPELDELKQLSEKALSEGRIEDYNEIEGKIRSLSAANNS